MPTEIIELDPIVPDEITFRYRGQDFTLPGDIGVRDTFKLQKLMVALAEAEQNVIEEKEGALGHQEKLTLEVEGALLSLFQQKDPDLDELPFGTHGFRIVLATVLTKLGFGGLEEDEEPDPPKPARSRNSSGRSSTSRSSSKSSGSRTQKS